MAVHPRSGSGSLDLPLGGRLGLRDRLLLTLVQDLSPGTRWRCGSLPERRRGCVSPLLMVGYGRAGELLAKAFDALGQQLVVIDQSSDRSTLSIWGPITRTFLVW